MGDCQEGAAPLFPVNDSRFFNPVHMSDEIWNYLVKTGQASGEKDWGTIICSFQNSMALSFASVIQGLGNQRKEKRNCLYGRRRLAECEAVSDDSRCNRQEGSDRGQGEYVPGEIWATA